MVVNCPPSFFSYVVVVVNRTHLICISNRATYTLDHHDLNVNWFVNLSKSKVRSYTANEKILVFDCKLC